MDARRAAELVGGQFPALRGAAVRPLAAGWDNTVLMVGDVLFRFPRRASALPLQHNELTVLGFLAGRLPLPVPVPSHLGQPAGDYPWPFWGCAMLPGQELALRPQAPRRHAAEAVGAFLRALHALPADLDLPQDPMGRGTPVLRAERTTGSLQALVDRGVWDWSGDVRSVVDSRLVPPPDPPVLVHGDLHLRHLLVDGAGRPTGVIDWGDTCLADPSVDLSIAYAAFTGGDREALLAAYGPVDAEREVRARALAVSLCAGLADWASSVGEPALLAEYLQGLRRSVS